MAEVAVKNASRKFRGFPSRFETGSIKSNVPARITTKKLPTINRVGLLYLGRALEEGAADGEIKKTPHSNKSL